MIFPVKTAPGSMKRAVGTAYASVWRKNRPGLYIIILSDRDADCDHAPIPSLLACAAFIIT